MPKKLDPAIGDVLKKYGFGTDACWDCHGVWVVYHKVCEQIAVRAGITFDPPQIVEADGANKVAAVCVTGHMDARSEWSIGEASPGNNKNAYPWAMAEKRAKDRVILKLIGLHGSVYSEDEADDFKPPAPTNGNPPGITKFREESRAFYTDLYACEDYDQYVAFVTSPPVEAFLKRAQKEFPKDWLGDGKDLKGIKQDMKNVCEKLKAKEAA